MTNPQSEPKIKLIDFRFHWWWVVLLVVLAGFALFGDKGVLRLIKTYNHRSDLQLQVERLATENQHLKEVIESLQNDHSTIERIAREELGMVRKDEIVYQFPNQTKSPQSKLKPAE